MTADNMPRCKTCAHWRVTNPFWVEVMANDPGADGWGECRRLKPCGDFDVRIDDGWLRKIETGAFFGCAAHEERGE